MPIEYPPFEAPLSTDLLTSVALTGTNHAEDQPVHLRVVSTQTYIQKGKKNPAVGAGVGAVRSEAEVEDDAAAEGEKTGEEDVQDELERRRRHVKINYGQYAGLLGRACPAGVYEYVPEEGVAPGETEGWGGHKLVINSQVCDFFHRSDKGSLMTSSNLVYRIVFIVNFAMSKCPLKILHGQYPKVGAGQSIVSNTLISPADSANKF